MFSKLCSTAGSHYNMIENDMILDMLNINIGLNYIAVWVVSNLEKTDHVIMVPHGLSNNIRV